MRMFSGKMRTGSLVVLLTSAAIALPALPASAVSCGPLVPCIPDWVKGQTDIFGGVYGVACGGIFKYEADEGTRVYYSGPVTDGTYVDSDPDTKHMTVTCSVQTADTVGSGTVRGSVTAQSVAPLNNVVSAAGLPLEYWYTYPHDASSERLWLCTTVVIQDHLGVTYTHSYDANSSRSGAQCLELVPLLDV